jgi:hypothetical protein
MTQPMAEAYATHATAWRQHATSLEVGIVMVSSAFIYGFK